MALPQRIKELRTRNGLSQAALADRLHVSRQAVTKWEAGRGIPDVDNLRAMAALFGVSVDHLLDGAGDAATPAVLRHPVDVASLEPYKPAGRPLGAKSHRAVREAFPDAVIYPLARMRSNNRVQEFLEWGLMLAFDTPTDSSVSATASATGTPTTWWSRRTAMCSPASRPRPSRARSCRSPSRAARSPSGRTGSVERAAPSDLAGAGELLLRPLPRSWMCRPDGSWTCATPRHLRPSASTSPTPGGGRRTRADRPVPHGPRAVAPDPVPVERGRRAPGDACPGRCHCWLWSISTTYPMNRASGKLTAASAPDSSASRTRFAAAKQSADSA